MTQDSEVPTLSFTRRRFLASAAGTLAATLAGPIAAQTGTSDSRTKPTVRAPSGSLRKPNLIFVFTDQERYFSKWPSGLSLPAHERLQRTGTTFRNHYCPAVMCTSSRSVLMTGLQTVDNRMFENCDVKYVKDLSTDIPTLGHMLRKAGYYTAYKGKWHLSSKTDIEGNDRLLTKEMERYGFSDYNSIGDIVGHTLGGYEFDHLIAGSAITWLRRHGRPLTDAGKPWCLIVSLVNPHDIMYFNTDAPDQKVQDTGHLVFHAARAPANEFYTANWDMPVPANLTQALDAPGRPRAHLEFQKMWDRVLGQVPLEEPRWRRFNDFYINSLRSVDAQVNTILNELDALRLTDRSIFFYTSDHGELAGSHGLRGKGPFAYEQGIHLPFYVVHPDVQGGAETLALSAHIDVAPTLLSLAGADVGQASEFAGRQLPGHDLSPVIGNPSNAGIHAVRDNVLFTYSGLVTNDGDLFDAIGKAKAAGKNPGLSLIKQGFKPNMKKRGTLRTVFDGRYKFTRYFSPLDHQMPKSLDEIYTWNDVELYDLQTDPEEMVNLGAEKSANAELVTTMNEKLDTAIKREMGKDDGRELPDIPFLSWEVDRIS
jgi:arylsulfatase A-like enzyme